MNNIKQMLDKSVSELSSDCKTMEELLHEYRFGSVNANFVLEVIENAMSIWQYTAIIKDINIEKTNN